MFRLGVVLAALPLLASCADSPVGTDPESQQRADETFSGCRISLEQNRLLFRDDGHERFQPTRASVEASVSCNPPSSEWQPARSVSVEGEHVEWHELECPGQRRICGDIVPRTHGRGSLTLTFDSITTTIPVIVNRLPKWPNWCEPDSHSQLCNRIVLTLEQGETVELDMSEYFTDPDGDTLRFAPNAVDPPPGFLSVEAIGLTMLRVEALVEGWTGSISVAVNDGFHQGGYGFIGPVQVGCPGVRELEDEGTGRFLLSYDEPQATLDECDRQSINKAVAYWERVLAGDSRQVAVRIVDHGRTWAGGDGAVPEPSGTVSIGTELGPLTHPLRFYNVLRHELAHVLGIGAGAMWWDQLVNPADINHPETVLDTHFTGERAYQEFLDLGGGDYYDSPGVPVANGGPSNVQLNTHWRSHIIDNEVMVGCDDVYAHFTEGVECVSPHPVSRLTLAALADMGWIVDMSMAEPGTRVGNFRRNRKVP